MPCLIGDNLNIATLLIETAAVIRLKIIGSASVGHGGLNSITPA